MFTEELRHYKTFDELFLTLRERARFSFFENDLDEVLNCYKEWVSKTQYMVFRFLFFGDNDQLVAEKFRCVKVAKRGNDVYRFRTRKTLKHIFKKIKLINPQNSKNKANVFFFTLTSPNKDI